MYHGDLPMERRGDDKIAGMHPNMGPVLREVMRDQLKNKPFRRGDIKVRGGAAPTSNNNTKNRLLY